ncbi:MAG: TorF family putative porin [Magnetospirillum sp.]|nr:TorF family putative porin [Magnetospirillum sp.]
MIRNGLMAIFGATALVLGAVNPAAAQIETNYGVFAPSVTVTSNYLFRGISQTERGAAAQGNLEYSYPAGMVTPYVGSFISNVQFPDGSFGQLRQRLEVDFFGGVRIEPVQKFILDFGAITYLYPTNTVDKNPNPQGVGNPQWNEVYGKASYDFGLAKMVASVFYTSQFSAASGKGIYVEGGADVPLPFLDLTAIGRVGRQTIERNANFGFPDYTTWNVGLSREVLGFVVTGMYSDTDVKRGASLGQDINRANQTITEENRKLTKGTFVLSVAKNF